MSFEPKKREEIEIDKFNIKSHLNTSLEADGISVSEDLISRTMDAIRLQEANGLDEGKVNRVNKKPILLYRYTRTLIAVAAAALVLVVGLNALRLLKPLGMKSDNETKNFMSYDAEETENYKADAPMDDSAEYDINSSDDLKLDTTAIDRGTEDEHSTVLHSERKMQGILNDAGLTFEDITFIGAADTSLITINSKTTGETKTISDREKIDELYSMLEGHVFMYGELEVVDTQYIIKLSSDDKVTQVVIGGSAITVDYTSNDLSTQSVFITADQSTLLAELEKFLVK